MKSCFLLVTLWVVACSVKGQSLSPGGVKGAIQWYSTDTSLNSPGLRSQLDAHTALPVGHASTGQLNFHPSLVVDGTSPFRIDLGTRDLHNASYFSVYQSQDTVEENSIWHITNDQKTTLVLTTDRMADLSACRYMNYRDLVRGQPKVNIYTQHKEKDSLPVAQQWWNIGARPVAPRVPVMNFKGLIPEIIAYDRVLNGHERLQVATYLALKYGITLTEPGATYLNSGGQIIWDGYNYSTWHHNIAGICRDDSAVLDQPVACSSNLPGLLTMTAGDTLNNNSFLLWGDNGKPLTPAPKTAGLPLLLQKTWLMVPTGCLHPFVTSMVLDTKMIDAPLPVNPVYWLVVDPAGEGKFTSASVGFIRMDQLDGNRKATFMNVTWDKDGSGKDVWGIIVAQDLLLVSSINQPACSSPRTGSLQTRIVGGQAPYQLIIQNGNGLLLNRRVDDNSSPVEFTDLGTGKYSLKVTDAQGRMYADSFYMNGQDAPSPSAIAASYTLPAGRPLQLNAAAGMPDGLAWQWTGPENFQSFSPQVSITAPGSYTLSCSKNGCIREQDVLVAASHDNILYDVSVYPNPSPAAFNARITLDQPAAVTMSVYAPDGRLISTNTGYGRANYQFSSALGSGGVYQLVFVSGLSKTTKSLVIAK
jgi:hypothetical protein